MRVTLLPLSLSLPLLLLVPSVASAQQPLPPPAAQPPPAQYQPPPQQVQPPPPGYGQPPPGYSQPPPGYGSGYPPPQQPYYQQQPPPPSYTAPPPQESESHAPKYSLWMGARVSYVGFGFSFYDSIVTDPVTKNERTYPETTGNFLGNGIAPQIDLGARISYRYIPYVFWEHGFMGQGHRFANTDARSTTDFYGIGFRYVSGDVDSVAFLTDLSIGKRVVSVTNGGQTYSMSGIEFFRLGLGAEIRLATLFALSPIFSISSGALNDSEGDVAFNCAPNCADGVNGPTYAKSTRGGLIQTSRAYVVLSLGVGIHFDIFGK